MESGRSFIQCWADPGGLIAVTADGGMPAPARYSSTPAISSDSLGSDSSTTRAIRSSGVRARRNGSNRTGWSSASTTAARASRTGDERAAGNGIRSASRAASDQRERPTGTSTSGMDGPFLATLVLLRVGFGRGADQHDGARPDLRHFFPPGLGVHRLAGELDGVTNIRLEHGVVTGRVHFAVFLIADLEAVGVSTGGGPALRLGGGLENADEC